MSETVEVCDFLCRIEDHPVAIQYLIATPITALLSVLIGLTTARFGRVPEIDKLKDPKSRPRAIARYRVGRSRAYFNAIAALLAWAERFYGPRWSWQSYTRCLQIAFFYPMTFVLAQLVLSEVDQLGGLEVFNSDPNLGERIITLALISFGWISTYVMLVNSGTIINVYTNIFDRIAPRTERSSEQSTMAFAKFGANSIIFLIAFFNSTSVLTFSTSTYSTSFLVVVFATTVGIFSLAYLQRSLFAIGFLIIGFTGILFTSSLEGIYSLTETVSPDAVSSSVYSLSIALLGILILLTLPLSAILIVLFLAGPELATSWLFLFCFLPLTNSLLDFCSVNLTRWFLSKITKKDQNEKRIRLRFVFFNLLLDLFAAAICLTFLITLTIGVLELWAELAPNTLIFQWDLYWADIQQNPSHGTALYMMCLTTLLPTIIHVIAGLGAVLTHKSRIMHRVADRLEALPGEPDLNDIDDALRDLRWAAFWGYSSASLLTLFPLAVLVIWLL